MPRRRWDDPWQRYPASVPLPAEGGLVTSKRRGTMAETWWSRRFIDALESYGLGARMQRGRRYARSGQVLTLDVRTAVIAAQVQGSRRTPYLVTVSLPEPSATQWRKIESAMAAKIGFVARLLAGEVPPDLEGAFDTAGVALFPGAWRDVRADCSCPDWENPCKHIAAVLYVFADQLDTDPWLLLRWRGRSRDELLGPLQNRSGDEPPAEEIAPWWPFPPGALRPLTDVPPASASPLVDPECPEAVLDQLEELDVVVAGVPFRDVIRAAYQHLPSAGGDGAVGPSGASQPAVHAATTIGPMTERDWRRSLRGAVYRADGVAVVASVRTGGIRDDALQLLGDGLLVAIIGRVEHAVELGAECVNALRARAWYGDDDLAEQLDAALGRGAPPMRRSLPVDLDELATILEGDPVNGGGRIDLRTGEVWHRAAIDYAREMGEEDEDESDDPDRWLWVDCEGSRDAYRDMEWFIGTIADRDRADRLEIAIEGKGAFRRFKDVLARWPDELERWYAFSEERQRGRARAWLAAAGYCPAPPSHPGPEP